MVINGVVWQWNYVGRERKCDAHAQTRRYAGEVRAVAIIMYEARVYDRRCSTTSDDDFRFTNGIFARATRPKQLELRPVKRPGETLTWIDRIRPRGEMNWPTEYETRGCKIVVSFDRSYGTLRRPKCAGRRDRNRRRFVRRIHLASVQPPGDVIPGPTANYS